MRYWNKIIPSSVIPKKLQKCQNIWNHYWQPPVSEALQHPLSVVGLPSFFWGGLRSSFGHWSDVKSNINPNKSTNQPPCSRIPSVFLYAVLLVFRSPTGRKKHGQPFFWSQATAGESDKSSGLGSSKRMDERPYLYIATTVLPLFLIWSPWHAVPKKEGHLIINPHVLLNLLAFDLKKRSSFITIQPTKKNI